MIGLFPQANGLRIITTNFDRHFSTAGRIRFNHDLETHYAPALPLGRNFSGIVYLHGSVDKPRNGLVLTDSDFGRAYLSEAWATRMLVEVFAHFVVLFVGYSHNDPVMHYLVRSSSSERFILTTAAGDDKWSYLGITPIHFPAREDGDR